MQTAVLLCVPEAEELVGPHGRWGEAHTFELGGAEQPD